MNLNGGLRLTSEKKNGIAFNAGYTNDTFTVVNAVTANYKQVEDVLVVAPKIGLDYKVSDKIMAYGTLSRGFKSGDSTCARSRRSSRSRQNRSRMRCSTLARSA